MFRNPKNACAKEIEQYDCNRNFMRSWRSIAEVSSELNLSRKSIVRNIKKNTLYNGCYWLFKNDDIDNEIWSSLYFSPSIISISNLGRVKDKMGRISYGSKHRGYRRYNDYAIHRLVMLSFCFIENADSFVVDHINGIKDDNRLENLRWCTRGENNQFARDLKPFKTQNHTVSVDQFDLDNNFIARYPSIVKASEQNNICASSIGGVCSGKRKTAGNFLWKYSENITNPEEEIEPIIRKESKFIEIKDEIPKKEIPKKEIPKKEIPKKESKFIISSCAIIKESKFIRV